ncbi:hypothetical protein SDC9_101376 [bioreactor metagenome]|uniref:Uncharacterized protein n=1 Tax=bioreactor metagenome TaxID=1076179 RepID=A0A645APA6_9ZZZZ
MIGDLDIEIVIRDSLGDIHHFLHGLAQHPAEKYAHHDRKKHAESKPDEHRRLCSCCRTCVCRGSRCGGLIFVIYHGSDGSHLTCHGFLHMPIHKGLRLHIIVCLREFNQCVEVCYVIGSRCSKLAVELLHFFGIVCKIFFKLSYIFSEICPDLRNRVRLLCNCGFIICQDNVAASKPHLLEQFADGRQIDDRLCHMLI